jgi:multidrug efflux pump subunit AcrB
VLVTPREEEPQINVTMASVIIPFPGPASADVQNLVARPAEQVLGQIAGIEHTYSVVAPRRGGVDGAVQGRRCRAPRHWCACTM